MRTKERDGDTKNNLTLLGTAMLIIIPLFVIGEYSYTSYVQHKAENLVTLTVTSSDSPEYVREMTEGGGVHERYVLKAQEFNCHFWILGEPLEIVKSNRRTRELLESIQRGDKLSLIISEKDKDQLGSLYFEARLFGLSKNDDILFLPEQLKILKKDSMNSTLLEAIILEIIIFLGLMWRRIRMKQKRKLWKEQN